MTDMDTSFLNNIDAELEAAATAGECGTHFVVLAKATGECVLCA